MQISYSSKTCKSGLLTLALSLGGRVSIGLMHATPGDMKSFRSSAERMADIRGAQKKRASDQDRTGPRPCMRWQQ
jgi:hypothetical protein